MKYYALIPVFILSIFFNMNISTKAEEKSFSSRITSVKLYQNQAKIVRIVKLKLSKGTNNVILGNLPPLLYDWSVKGRLPLAFKGKIVSMEIVKKALVKKRQKRILKIEEKLMSLREKDQVFVDDLKNIKDQEKFLNSILNFTNQTVAKELATRIPQVKVWDNTLSYVSLKKKELLRQKRTIEKKREMIGKEIQKWEFELSQIAGSTYFRNYQSLNKVILKNRAAMNIQQFAEITGEYAERYNLLRKPREKVDIEKRVIIDIFSSQDTEVILTFSYVIPKTYWKMMYDIRANSKKKKLNMVVYGNIYQKTGEDWNRINLSMSTGLPVNSIQQVTLSPWFLDIYRTYRKRSYARTGGSVYKTKKSSKGYIADKVSKDEKKKEGYVTEVKDKGPYIEIILPLKQSILSSTKYQKKYIKDYQLLGENVTFYYEVTPAVVRNAYYKVRAVNTTGLPWLAGEAQIFLDNEFMGKVSIPFTPPGKKENLVLGVESRITSKKEIVKKFEDSAGVFKGKRRITYKYKLTVENQLPEEKKIILYDALPLTRNKKIKVEVKNLSLPFMEDEEFKKTTRYSQGIRKWELLIQKGKKTEITYDVIISFDKELTIQGLR